MAIADEAFANQAPQHPPIDLGSLSGELEELCSADRCADQTSAMIYSASLVMQAGELRNSLAHGAGCDTLGSQLGGLLCDLVRFASLCEVDVVKSTELHLEALRQRADVCRPKLRSL